MYSENMRRAVACLSSLGLALGLLVGLAPAASAADLGTVTVSYSMGYLVSPTTLSGSSGDTFTLTQDRYDDAGSYVSLVNGTGSVTLAGTSCSASTSCPVYDDMSAPHSSSGVFTIVTPGTVLVNRYLAAPTNTNTTISTLTISSQGATSGEAADPSLVYPTAYLNANGGTCTGTLQFTKYNGENGTVSLPTGAACTRTDHTLYGWARSESATFPTRDFTPGATIPIGDESFTLYAVWQPNGILVSYDANVGATAECLLNGGDATTRERRSTPTVVAVGSASATSAPCTPPGHSLTGWRPAGDGAVAINPGATLPYPNGTTLVLYAQWAGPSYSVTLAASKASFRLNGSTTVTVTALRNGVPVPNARVALELTEPLAFSLGGGALSPEIRLTTGNDGRATATIVAGKHVNADTVVAVDSDSEGISGTGLVTAAYGNGSAARIITVVDPLNNRGLRKIPQKPLGSFGNCVSGCLLGEYGSTEPR